MSELVLTPEEVADITGYKRSTMQLNVLHRRGFSRAYIGRQGVVVERAHYDAVCRGQVGAEPARTKSANLSFLRRA